METETPDNATLIAAIVARLCTCLNATVSDDLTEGYLTALEGIDPVFVQAAADELLLESTWMPKPAEIRKVAKRIASESSTQPAEPEHWRRDAYLCQTCRDTGYVTCWHPRAMQSAIWHVRGKIERDRLQLPTCDARCTCSIGILKPSGVRKRKRQDGSDVDEPVRYDDWRMIHVDPALSAAQQIDVLLAWAREWKPKPKIGDRIDEFDTWNSEAF